MYSIDTYRVGYVVAKNKYQDNIAHFKISVDRNALNTHHLKTLTSRN